LGSSSTKKIRETIELLNGFSRVRKRRLRPTAVVRRGFGTRPCWDDCRQRAAAVATALNVVPLHVQRQVVGARERAVAQLALERAVAGVLAVVPRQLVRPGKLPAAPVPVALVRLLARVRAQVRL